MNSVAGAARTRGWYHGWTIVAAAILSQVAANGIPINAFTLFLHDWAPQFHAKNSTLVLGLIVLGLLSAVYSPVVGVLADKLSARWLFVAGLVGILIFHLGVSLTTETWQFLALFAVVFPPALTLSTAIPANAVISRWFVRRRGLALGLSSFGLSLAGIGLPPLVTALLPLYGWRAIWRAAAVLIAAIVIPFIIWAVRDRPGERDDSYYLTGDGGTAPPSLHGHHPASQLKTFDVFRSRVFWIIVIAYLSMLAVYGAAGQNLGPLASIRGLSQQTAGYLVSLFWLSQLVSTLAMGLLSDRIGNRLPLMGLALGTTAGSLLIAFGHGILPLGAGVVLVGASGGMWPLMAASMAVEFGADGFGRAFGLLILFLPLDSPAPFVTAKLQETTGSYTPAFAGLAVLTLIGAIACFFMREKRGVRSAPEAVVEPVLSA